MDKLEAQWKALCHEWLAVQEELCQTYAVVLHKRDEGCAGKSLLPPSQEEIDAYKRARGYEILVKSALDRFMDKHSQVQRVRATPHLRRVNAAAR